MGSETVRRHTTVRSTMVANRILELDGHTETVDEVHQDAPRIPLANLGGLADYCQYVGFHETAAELEILRRRFESDNEFIPMYVGSQFDQLLLQLALAKTHTVYNDVHTTDQILQLRGVSRSIGEWVEFSFEDPIMFDLTEDWGDPLMLPDGVETIGVDDRSRICVTDVLCGDEKITFYADGEELPIPDM